jgi:hypothetical protein
MKKKVPSGQRKREHNHINRETGERRERERERE